MKWLPFLIMIFSARCTLAQEQKIFNSTGEVADFINRTYQKEDDKIKAIYYWVTSNFRYDPSNTFAINAGPDPTAKITIAFKRRKGVCDNISAIFNDICLKSGIRSVIINGYTKQGNAVDRSGHSWCAASIDNNWYFFDPTWDLQNTLNPRYFMVSPIENIKSHMPFDPLWQLMEFPVSHAEFSGKVKSAEPGSYFNYSDSVTTFFRMDSLERLKATASRIERYGIYNERIKVNYQVVKMNIEIAFQEEQVESYKVAVDTLNSVTKNLNQFIEYRNNQFLPLRSDQDLKHLLKNAEEGIKFSLIKFDNIDSSKAKLVLSTESERERITLLSRKIKDQKIFVEKYLSTELAARHRLFYEKK